MTGVPIYSQLILAAFAIHMVTLGALPFIHRIDRYVVA